MIRPMRVEIWSDLMCPFCYIGKRHFEAALEGFEGRDDVEVVWRSFQLDPALPRETEDDVYGMLARKFGWQREEARARADHVLAQATAAGLDYDMDAAVPTNTFDAHRLVHLAAAHGLQDAAEERLFAAYFTAGENLADHATLVRLGGEIGLDPGDVADVLASDAYAEDVVAECREAGTLGLTGVPAFVIDRRVGIFGAQPVEHMLDVLRQASTPKS
jgi:predicted DsbA family dithiol-disulfide isomerase